MTSNRAPRPDLLNAALATRPAQRVLARYRRDGRVALRTSAASAAGVVGLALGAAALFAMLAATTPAGQRAVVWVAAVVLVPTIALLATSAVRLLVPWNRVVVDREGLVVLGRRLRWDEIEWFATDAKINGRRVVEFVTVQIGTEAAEAWRPGRWRRFAGFSKRLGPGEIALPFWLDTPAEPLAAALQSLVAGAR